MRFQKLITAAVGLSMLVFAGGALNADVGIDINETNFPDEELREYAKNHDDNGDDKLSWDEIEEITYLNFNTSKYKNLKGIEYFKAAKQVQVYGTGEYTGDTVDYGAFIYAENMTLDRSIGCSKELDLTTCKNLKYLRVYACSDTVDVTGLDKLETLDCANNNLKNTDLSSNTALKNFHFYHNYSKTDLVDISKNSQLQTVNVSDIKKLKVGKMPDLRYFSCTSEAALEGLDLSSSPKLYSFTYRAFLPSIDISNQPFLIDLIHEDEPYVYDNERTYSMKKDIEIDGEVRNAQLYLGVHANTAILDGAINIDTTNFPDDNFRAFVKENYDKNNNSTLETSELEVTKMDCSGRNIANLDGIKFFYKLKELNCSNNKLTTIVFGQTSQLTWLDCSNNEITDFTLAKNSDSPSNNLDKYGFLKLDYLDCSHNKLTKWSNGNYDIKKLNASYNNISSLMGPATAEYIDCSHNQITSVLVYTSENLQYLDCSNNKVTSVYGPEEGLHLQTLYAHNNDIQFGHYLSRISADKLTLYGNPLSSYDLNADFSTEYLRGNYKTTTIDGNEVISIGDRLYLDASVTINKGIPLNSEFFPDENLRKGLGALDKNSDGLLSKSEYNISSLDLSGLGIKDLSGLELMDLTLGSLDVSKNDLSELDLSAFRFIWTLRAVDNPNLKQVSFKPVIDYFINLEPDLTLADFSRREYNGYASYSLQNMVNSSFTFDKDVVLFADPVKITVSFDPATGSVTGSGLWEKGSEVTLKYTPAAGSSFGAWLENDKIVSTSATYTFTAESDRTLVASQAIAQPLSFDNASVTKTIGDKSFTQAVKGAVTAVSYSSSNTKVATVDVKTGAVTIAGIGSCTITAKAEASAPYLAGSASYKLTIQAKPTATPTPKPTTKPTAVPTTKVTTTPTTAVTVTATPSTTVTPTPEITAEPTDPKAQILAFVERIYIYVLDREPEEDGAAFWSDELYSFRRTGAEVAQGFIFSPEFEGRGTSDKEFVTILYKTFFGRDPEEDGMNFWLSQLSTGTMDRVTVANGFIYSQEWADTCASYGIRSGGDLKPAGKIEPTDLTYAFVERMYTTAMGRGYDEEGKQYWAGELANFNVTGEVCGAAFFLSDEMVGYNLSDKDYLGRLYATFMNREPDADGESYWLGVMASGASRADVVFGFTRSPEFTEKCIEARILPY